MSCYSCRAKVPFNNMLNHNIQKYYKVPFTWLWSFATFFSIRFFLLSGFVLLHLHIVFASGHYLIKESFWTSPTNFIAPLEKSLTIHKEKKRKRQSPSVKILELFLNLEIAFGVSTCLRRPPTNIIWKVTSHGV